MQPGRLKARLFDADFRPFGVRYVAGLMLAVVGVGCFILLTPATESGEGVFSAGEFLVLAIVVLAILAGVIAAAWRAAIGGWAGRPRDLSSPEIGLLAPFRQADSAIEAALRQQQAEHIATQLYVMMAINIANVGLVTAMIWWQVDPYVLALWALAVSFLAVLAIVARMRARPNSGRRRTSKRTLRRITFHSGLRGLLWGMCFAAFFAQVDATGQLILLSVSLGMLAGGVPALAPVPSAAMVFGLGVVIPTVLRLVAMGDIAHFVLAMFGLAFSGSMVMVGAQLYRNFSDNFLARREQSEQAATISLLLREFENTASDWLWETGRDGRLTRAPERMYELLGFDAGDGGTSNLAEVLARIEGGETSALQHCLEGEAGFRDVSVKSIDRSGAVRWLSFAATPQPGGGFRGVGSDVTERTLARLAASEARQRAENAERRLTDSLDLLVSGFVLSDALDRTVLANRQFREMFPVAGEFEGGAEFDRVVRLQAERWAELHPAADAGWGAKLLTARGSGRASVDVELPTGTWVRVETRTTAEGGTVSLLTDITDIKEAEERLAAQARRLAASNRELKKFAEVASHDLQEPLRKIETFATRLGARAMDDLDDDGKLYLTRLTAATQRMRQLIGDLLVYTRVMRQSLKICEVDLAGLVGEIERKAGGEVKKRGGEIRTERMGRISADERQMLELLESLVLNGLKFARPGVAPVITVRQRSYDVAGFSEIEVEDNGIGFDMKHHDQIFEIFQRLHSREAYDGTGVGLATCRKIAERHGGTIRAESVPGVGTRFIVRLPRVIPDEETAEQAAA